MAKFMTQGPTDAIRWGVHVHKEHDRHPVNPLAYSVDQVAIKIAWDNYSTLFFKQLDHVVYRTIRKHPEFTQITSCILN